MEYIDKTALEDEGEAIIGSFLKRLKAEGANYPQDLYQVFKSDKDETGVDSQAKLVDVLLKEQEYRCCYCMRRLTKENEVTLEHLILNRITRQDEFITYFKRKTVLNEKVCLAFDFIHNDESKVPPYPHTVAYQNLTASCNGRIMSSSRTVYCCNLKRGKEYVEPVVLYDTIRAEIDYKQNGRAVWNGEQNSIPTLNKLGLNDAILRMVRRIWIYSKDNGIDLGTVERRTFLFDILSELSEEEFKDVNEFKMLLNFQTDTYWNLLKEYSYFGI